MACDYINNCSSQTVQNGLTSLLAGLPPFDCNFLSSDNPLAWWVAGRRLGFPEDLCTIAQELLSSVCSSAGLERFFSTMRVTYGELRTQLGVEKSGKLSFLYRVLNSK
jgi:hypothetical protein